MQDSDQPKMACDAMDTAQRGTTRPGLALVTWETVAISKVSASRPLHDITADGSHIPQLPRGREQKALADHGKALAYRRMCGQITHTCQRANAQAAVGAHINCRHVGQRIDVEEVIRKRGPVLDEAEEVRPARDKDHSPIGAVSC